MQRIFRGETSFHCTAASGHDKVMQLLLDFGADVNAKAGPYEPSLHLAAVSSMNDYINRMVDDL
jgi:ankyrin repeat protein